MYRKTIYLILTGTLILAACAGNINCVDEIGKNCYRWCP